MRLLTRLVDECELINDMQNFDGDHIYVSDSVLACRFREITTLRQTPNQELTESDAMLWLEPSANVSKGSIILYDDMYYQIEKITKARRLGSTEVLFLKCELKVISPAIS